MSGRPERPSLTMPEELTRRARAVAVGDEDSWMVPDALDAATVILLRDGPAGPEVFLQRRAGGMAFAPGAYVFPGGRAEDSDATLPWVGPDSEPFATPEPSAPTASFRALTTAAAREAWEESGVVIVDAPAGDAPGDEGFGPWLRDGGHRVAGDSFAPWSHWITPEVERRRFDTRFLVARMPIGQVAVDLGVESDHSSWFRPQDAVDRVRRGAMTMLPPTVHALDGLTLFETVADVLDDARGRRPRPLLPRPTVRSGNVEWHLVDAYSGEEIG